MDGDILKKHYFNNIIESDAKTKIINRIYNDFLNRDVDESGICTYYDCTENEEDILKIQMKGTILIYLNDSIQFTSILCS